MLPNDTNTGDVRHNAVNVYGEQFRQIQLDYATLPNPRRLRLAEIAYYYDGLRPTLRAHTKPRKA